MTSSRSSQTPTTSTERTGGEYAPRWLIRTVAVCVGLLLLVVILFVLGYAFAGPEDNLAGVLLILAAVAAVPMVGAGGCWAVGRALRDRAPSVSLALVILSAIIGGFGVLLLALFFLPAIGS